MVGPNDENGKNADGDGEVTPLPGALERTLKVQLPDVIVGDQVLNILLGEYGHALREVIIKTDDELFRLVRDGGVFYLTEATITRGKTGYFEGPSQIRAIYPQPEEPLAEDADIIAQQRLKTYLKTDYDAATADEAMQKLLLDPSNADANTARDIAAIWRQHNEHAKGLSHHKIIALCLHHPLTPPDVLTEIYECIEKNTAIIRGNSELRTIPVYLFGHPNTPQHIKRLVFIAECSWRADWHNMHHLLSIDPYTADPLAGCNITPADCQRLIADDPSDDRLRIIARSSLAVRPEILDILSHSRHSNHILGLVLNTQIDRMRRIQILRMHYTELKQSQYLAYDTPQQILMGWKELIPDLADEIDNIIAEDRKE